MKGFAGNICWFEEIVEFGYCKNYCGKGRMVILFCWGGGELKFLVRKM